MPTSTPRLAPDLYTGRHIGEYELLCKLAVGGMSEVLLALKRGLAGFQKLVVVKKILPQYREDQEFVTLFLDEARNTSGFTHPNVAQVYDLNRDGDELFVALEFVPGVALSDLVTEGPMPIGFAVAVIRDVAMALHYAHTRRAADGRVRPIIHRDVAPKNVMISFDGTTKLLDFGVAKKTGQTNRTAIGVVRGTLGYMSPEQMCGEELGPTTDIYSLGLVLYEILTGRPVYTQGAPADLVRAVLYEKPTPPSKFNSKVTPTLDAVVLKAIAADKKDRFQSGSEFAQVLEKATGIWWSSEQAGDYVRQRYPEWYEKTRLLVEADRARVDIVATFHRLPVTARPKAIDPAAAASVLEEPPQAPAPRKPPSNPVQQPAAPTKRKSSGSTGATPRASAEAPAPRPPEEARPQIAPTEKFQAQLRPAFEIPQEPVTSPEITAHDLSRARVLADLSQVRAVEPTVMADMPQAPEPSWPTPLAAPPSHGRASGSAPREVAAERPPEKKSAPREVAAERPPEKKSAPREMAAERPPEKKSAPREVAAERPPERKSSPRETASKPPLRASVPMPAEIRPLPAETKTVAERPSRIAETAVSPDMIAPPEPSEPPSLPGMPSPTEWSGMRGPAAATYAFRDAVARPEPKAAAPVGTSSFVSVDPFAGEGSTVVERPPMPTSVRADLREAVHSGSIPPAALAPEPPSVSEDPAFSPAVVVAAPSVPQTVRRRLWPLIVMALVLFGLGSGMMYLIISLAQ